MAYFVLIELTMHSIYKRYANYDKMVENISTDVYVRAALYDTFSEK